MDKAKMVLAAVLLAGFLASIGACVVVDRKELNNFRRHGDWGYYDRHGHFHRV